MDLTVAFTLAIIAAVIIFDVVIILLRGNQASISALIIKMAYQYPWIAFLVGFVCGHLFWQMPGVCK